jgi:hypothetical protein
MKLFFDERCLGDHELTALLRSWREIADYARMHTPGLSLFLDRHAVHGPFLSRFNEIRSDLRILFAPVLFGSELVGNWRTTALCADSICQLETENDPVQDCSICEVYEHRKSNTTIALFGHAPSSFVGRQSVGVDKLTPLGARMNVVCGTALVDLTRIGAEWGCLLIVYSLSEARPPRDYETILGRTPERFVRVGRVERNGRRTVYRELATDRFFYVDNLHFGPAAHLEVFGSDESHLGTADLNGVLDTSTRVNGRRISW